MSERIGYSKFFGRLFEILIPASSWILITMPLWLSIFHPAIVAYFIIAFDLYFLYKSVTFAYLATVSYRKILELQKVPFYKKILSCKNWKEVKHFVIIPNYKESLDKLESTVELIAASDYPEKIYLMLAFEKREPEARKKAEILKSKFSSRFSQILTSYHELFPNEVQGKASNQTFAAKKIDEFVSLNHWKRENVLITVCDADSHLPQHYFSYLTYKFLLDDDRIHHFYWAAVLLYNNFWQLPFFVRMQATLSSIMRLAFLSKKDQLIQISTYSTNLWLLKKINFWDVDIIPEDWHVFYQAFFMFGNRIRTIPLYTIVNGDAVFSGGLLKTGINRYEQERRWAWGVSDVGYTLRKFFTTPQIPVFAKLKRITFLAEAHLLWPVSFFILTISASIPPLINPYFKQTVLGFLLPKLSALILTSSSLLLILYVYLDHKLRLRVDQKTKISAVPFLFIQWYLLPLVSFFFSSLPALEAHTRLLFGKKIKYKVTEKV